MRMRNHTGKKFGRLTAVKRVGTAPTGSAIWLCRCKCGNEVNVRANVLTRGDSQSCGCLKKLRSAQRLKVMRKYHDWPSRLADATKKWLRKECARRGIPRSQLFLEVIEQYVANALPQRRGRHQRNKNNGDTKMTTINDLCQTVEKLAAQYGWEIDDGCGYARWNHASGTSSRYTTLERRQTTIDEDGDEIDETQSVKVRVSDHSTCYCREDISLVAGEASADDHCLADLEKLLAAEFVEDGLPMKS